MRIKVRENLDGLEVLPAILDYLPDTMSAWISLGEAIIYDKDVEIARVPVLGLTPEEAVGAVAKKLKGVV